MKIREVRVQSRNLACIVDLFPCAWLAVKAGGIEIAAARVSQCDSSRRVTCARLMWCY